MSGEPDNITTVVLREIRDELRGLRRELVDVRMLSLGTFDRMKRLERRLEETRDDLETTVNHLVSFLTNSYFCCQSLHMLNTF